MSLVIASKRTCMLRLLSGLAIFAVTQQAVSSPTLVDLTAGPANWATNAPNSVVQLDPSLVGGIATPAMWSCPPGLSQQDCAANVDRAAFGKSFVLDQGATVGGAFSILADDLLVLRINGNTFAAALDQNKGPGTAPKPLTFRVEQYDLVLTSGTLYEPPGTVPPGSIRYENIFRPGQNVINIQGFDGYFNASKPEGVSCAAGAGIPDYWCLTDRGNAYVHVAGVIAQVPEPGTIGLLAAALAGVAAFARRRANVAS